MRVILLSYPAISFDEGDGEAAVVGRVSGRGGLAFKLTVTTRYATVLGCVLECS